MEIKKILYVIDHKEEGFSSIVQEKISSMRNLNMEEIIFLKSSSSDARQSGISDFNIPSRVLVKKRLSPAGIIDTAEEEGVTLIIIDTSNKESRRSFIKKLINRTALPVLFLNDTAISRYSNEDGLFGHAVFATDLTSVANTTLGFLLGLKEVIKELEIVNVINKKLTVKDMDLCSLE